MTAGPAPTQQPTGHDAGVPQLVPVPGLPATTSAHRNDIPARQNGQQALEWLAARYDRYRGAQVTWGAQVILVVLVPAVLTILQALVPDMQRWAAAYGTLILCLDLQLDAIQDRFRLEGANVQERFDRWLYGLAWPRASLGEPPSIADVTIWARNGRAAATQVEQSHWADWYPPILGRLPLSVARLACQYANGWWDAKQRRAYATYLRRFGWLVPMALVAVSLALDLRVGAAFNALLTLAPLMVWCWREASRHEDTADARERVMLRASEALRLAGDGTSHELLTTEAADMQRDVFEQRRRAPAFPAWLYDRLRGEYEAGMHASASAVVDEYETAERARRFGERQ